jgi:hypothetical protein
LIRLIAVDAGRRTGFAPRADHDGVARLFTKITSRPGTSGSALATELLDSVEGADDDGWDRAWLAELDRRAEEATKDPNSLEEWATVNARLLGKFRAK